MADEINLTLLHPPTGRTDAVCLTASSTTLSDLADFAAALLGLEDVAGGVGGGVVLSKNALLYRSGGGGEGSTAAFEGSRTLGAAGLENGDLVSVLRASEDEVTRRRPTRPPPPAAAAPAAGIDFSALLNGASSTPAPAANNSSGGGGLSFDIAGILAADSAQSRSQPTQAQAPVQWDRMNLDDVLAKNPNPLHVVTIISDTTRHPNLIKELNYHNPDVAKKLAEKLGDLPSMAQIWRDAVMKSGFSNFMARNSAKNEESEMRSRLVANPMDEQANKYFGDKIRKDNVQRQYEQMIEEYPEAMGRVLMLYINTTVNGKPLQAFVDSGAQTTIMSSVCADRLGILHLVDERFAGIAVGVGTGKILGKVHVVELAIGDVAFPCSITIMDSDAGLGDKNMDCLFGLDMMKRHRCSVDLAKNALVFHLPHGQGTMDAPFLHEKDLMKSKGGTLDFDPEKENAELEAEREKRRKEREEGSGGGGKGEDEKKKAESMDESK